MRRTLFLKGLMVGGLALLLLIPLLMIEGQMEARNARQLQVARDIAEIDAGQQQLVGPLVVVGYQEEVVNYEKNEKTGEQLAHSHWEEGHQILVPHTLQMTSKARVDERHRGIFKAQAYEIDGELQGEFQIPARFGLEEGRKIRFGRAHVVLGLTDLRGIRKPPVLQWDGKELEFKPGTAHGVLDQGIQTDLGQASTWEGRRIPFSLPLSIKGSQSFSVAPVAESTKVIMDSPWTTPSFQGHFSADHSEGPQGFHATWEVSHLSRDLAKILVGKGCTSESFGVVFLKGDSVYLQSERAVKYGFLFVGFIFAAFFFFEMLRRLPIHPIQYLLVGLAIAIFFLLLLSLSERIPFWIAYVCASAACTGLLGAYLVHVLQSPKRGWGFAGGLAILFAVLYGLISSEDNALLMGSLVLFLGLAAIMLGTRRINWYALSEQAPSTLES
jgi:inner membrane protein